MYEWRHKKDTGIICLRRTCLHHKCLKILSLRYGGVKKELLRIFKRCDKLFWIVWGPLAQRLEQPAHNRSVLGSNPRGSIDNVRGLPLFIASARQLAEKTPFALCANGALSSGLLPRRQRRGPLLTTNRGCGGIGRRKGLKIPRWRHRAGSSPATRIKEKERGSFSFSFSLLRFSSVSASRAAALHPVSRAAPPGTAPSRSPRTPRSPPASRRPRSFRRPLRRPAPCR